MSLTSLLKSDRELANRLASLLHLAEVQQSSELPLIAPPGTKNYALVGTAFDYLFRFEVQRRNPSANAVEWVAMAAADMLKGPESPDGLITDKNKVRMYLEIMKDCNTSEVLDGKFSKYVKVGADIYHVSESGKAEQAAAVLENAKSAHARFLGISNPSADQVSEIAGHSLRLAKLDAIFREGRIDSSLESVDLLDVEDLYGLWKIIPFDGPLSACLAEDVWLNPTFGRFSEGIGGADADVVASTILIDIKTSVHPDMRRHAAQLVGYAMLAQAYRTEEAQDFPALDSVGVYFARQGTLISLSLEPARKHPDYDGALKALMAHCRDASSEHANAGSKKRTSKPVGQPSKRSSKRSSR